MHREHRRHPTYPGDTSDRLVKVSRNLRHRHGYGEKVKGIPCPAQKTGKEHQPLMGCEVSEDGDGVSDFMLKARLAWLLQEDQLKDIPEEASDWSLE